jgi:hypothetical protein
MIGQNEWLLSWRKQWLAHPESIKYPILVLVVKHIIQKKEYGFEREIIKFV